MSLKGLVTNLANVSNCLNFNYQVDLSKSVGELGAFTLTLSCAGNESESDDNGDLIGDDSKMIVSWSKTF